mmetsp:Transcript_57531/g.94481  ORF Transcript_57531/g.94481 Transcript_57531/m.94481 type:complete len:82 (-) Transcript_57531:26-271(-)
MISATWRSFGSSHVGVPWTPTLRALRPPQTCWVYHCQRWRPMEAAFPGGMAWAVTVGRRAGHSTDDFPILPVMAVHPPAMK